VSETLRAEINSGGGEKKGVRAGVGPSRGNNEIRNVCRSDRNAEEGEGGGGTREGQQGEAEGKLPGSVVGSE